MPIEVATDLDYLIPELRFRIGDTDSTAYRYLDSWLRVALVSALKALQRWWRVRYTIDETTYVVSRWENSTFEQDAPPTIMQRDEIVILTMASFLIKTGTLQNSAWSTGSWRDAEIAVSNIEAGRIRDASLLRDWDELMMYLTPPNKKLFVPTRDTIPGAEENSA